MFTFGEYLLPATLHEALDMVSRLPGDGKVIAGGTDLVPWAREGRAGDVHVPVVVDISRVREMHGYTIANGKVRLNANVVFQDFLSDETLRRHLPCMPHCAIWFADDQLREQATLAGNLVNASPAADGTPPIVAMDGVIELARLERGEIATRNLPIADFVLGPGKTAMQPGELITAVTVADMQGYGGSFQKVGQRRSLVISKVCCAALVKIEGDVFDDVRIALGGVGPIPARLTEVEDMLRGQKISPQLIADACVAPAERVASRSMIEYRKVVVRCFVEAAIEDALVAAGAPKPTQSERELADA